MMDVLQTPGPIDGFFFAQFHPTVGPQLKYKYPADCINTEIFDKFSNFIIPKPEVLQNVVTINTLGIKIKGYPNKIENPKYERNELLFNLCLVFQPDARTSPYEPLVRKLSEYLHSLETENGFLSHEESRQQLPLMLEQLYHDLNTTGRCVLKLKLLHPLHVAKEREFLNPHSDAGGSDGGERRLSLSSSDRRRRDSTYERARLGAAARGTVERGRGTRGGPSAGESCGGRGCALDRDVEQPEEIAVLYLKVVDACGAPVPVGEEQVPVLVRPNIVEEISALDLTTQQILPYIDGVAHVAKIAYFANVELDLAKKCVQNLVYYEIVQLLPIFQYSNVYVYTDKLRQLYWSSVLQQKCLEYVIGDPFGEPLLLDDVFRLYSKFQRGRTVRQICYCELQLEGATPPPSLATSPDRDAPRPKPPPNVDIRRLVNFGLMHGLIKRIQPYPICRQPDTDKKTKKDRRQEPLESVFASLRRYCDGTASFDLLCSKFGLSYRELEKKLARDKEVAILWK